MQATVYRNIDRPARMLGLEMLDLLIWSMTLFTLDWSLPLGFLIVASTWLFLFFIKFKKPERYLLNLIRFRLYKILCRNHFSASKREARHGPWLALRDNV